MSNESKWKFSGCSIRLDDTDVARVYQHYGLSEAEFKRRGKLLAAAPELLEALQFLLPHAEHAESCGDSDAYNNADVQTCGCGLDAAIELASIAITKATGE